MKEQIRNKKNLHKEKKEHNEHERIQVRKEKRTTACKTT